MPIRWEERIVSSAEVLRGKPRIKNTRIPASLILGHPWIVEQAALNPLSYKYDVPSK